MTSRTKKYKKIKNCLGILSVLLNCFPIIFYTIKAMSVAEPKEKLVLGITFFSACILTALNFIGKFNFRSVIWIVFIGIYQAVTDVMPLILMIAACTIVDEFIVTPFLKNAKAKYVINKEIDLRE